MVVVVGGEGRHIHCLPALLCLDKATSSKTNSIIMLCIGGGILVTMFLLIGVVFLLYFKVAKALRRVSG